MSPFVQLCSFLTIIDRVRGICDGNTRALYVGSPSYVWVDFDLTYCQQKPVYLDVAEAKYDRDHPSSR